MKARRLKRVESSSCRGVLYDSAARHLYIAFSNARMYRYIDVPAEVFAAMMEAPSMGRFVNSVVKVRFLAEDVDEPYELDDDVQQKTELSLLELLPGLSCGL
jgi:hypothetical protein